jgi:alpha-ketoglutarate-dependent taurine dioxygenase
MRGLTLRQSLNKLIKSKSYQRLSPESEPGLPSPRIQQINSILTRYRKEAKRQMLREYPELDRQFAALTRAKAGFRTGMQREDVLELLTQ